VTPADACLAALAAALDPAEGPGRLARSARAGAAREAARLAALPGGERLAAVAEALAAVEPAVAGEPTPEASPRDGGPEPPADPGLPSCAAGGQGTTARPARSDAAARLRRRTARELAGRGRPRTLVRAADAGPLGGAAAAAGGRVARSVEGASTVLPFDLPRLGRGAAEAGASARAVGARGARLAADALAALLEVEVAVEGRLLPGPASLGAAVPVPIDLPGLPGAAVLAVECSLAAALADRLAGGAGHRSPATSLSPTESVVLDLLALAAVDAVAGVPEVAAALSPRLGCAVEPPEEPVAVDLLVAAGPARGRALLLLPRAALRALRPDPELPDALAGAPVGASLLAGWTRAEAGEVEALAPGDVLLLDAPPGDRAALAWPGGGRAAGRLGADGLEVEEVDVARTTAAARGAPVLVEVDLGPAPVTLGDLARLEPGAVIPLGLPRTGRVALRLGDRVLAVGELVDVDGAVGVRVAALGEGP
jgi:type III secretion protein Q